MKKVFLISVLIIIFYSKSNSQAVSYDSIRINGTLPIRGSIGNLHKADLRIDSIIPNPPLFLNEPLGIYDPDSLLFIGSSCFAFYSKRRVYSVQIITFDKINNLRIGRFIIDRMTSSENLKTEFPEACNEMHPVKIGKTDRQYCSIPIKDKKGQIIAMNLLIFLYKERVIRIDFWEPM